MHTGISQVESLATLGLLDEVQAEGQCLLFNIVTQLHHGARLRSELGRTSSKALVVLFARAIPIVSGHLMACLECSLIFHVHYTATAM